MIFRVLPFFLLGAAAAMGQGKKNMLKKHEAKSLIPNHGEGLKKLNAKFKKVEGVKAAAGDITSGWAYQTVYETADCSGSYSGQAGYVLGVCIPIDVGSVWYTATIDGTDATLYRDWYSDTTDCTGTLGYTATMESSTTCDAGTTVSTSSKTNYPNSLSGGILYYESSDDTCDLDYYFDFVKTGKCIFDDSDDTYSSFKYTCSGNSGTFKMYASEDCSGSSDDNVMVLPDTCIDTNFDDDDGANNDDISLYLGYYELFCKEDDDDESTCFSAFETVTTINGDQVAISEVKVGDKILTVTESGEHKFADVVFVPHAANNQISATFHTIETSSGRSLKATRDHLIEAGECGMSKSLMAIDSVSAGMCVMTVDGEDRVLSNVMSKGQGVHTVVTSESSGKIVVNGMIASSFGTNHVMTNAYYNIHRAVYSVMPSMLKNMASVMVNGMFGEAMAKSVAAF